MCFCTQLEGKASWFLPFNRGWNDGAGNPPNPNGIKTDYLWREVLTRGNLTDILENYAQVMVAKDEKTGKKRKNHIWPRYHQRDVVRDLLADAAAQGAGRRYLIQHSAGSGKSNSIAWLAHQLIGLRKDGATVFDSIIVVTDRRILDKQINDTIRQYAQVEATVAHAERSGDLRRFIEKGKKIIISTVQKFPFILDEIGNEQRGRRFAILIDEAHSSQGGRTSAAMAQALSEAGAEGEDETFEDRINRLMQSRKLLSNASYFAFTATPKNKTLETFGAPDPQPDGTVRYRAFHSYTMKQAIQEGFILDVLAHYTPVQSYKKLAQHGVQGIVRAGGVVAVGGGDVPEPTQYSHDGDGGVAQRRQVARQVARRGSATVLVVAEVAHVVEPVFHFPVPAHEAGELVGAGLVGAQRGEAISHLAGGLPGFEDGALALDARRLPASVEVAPPVPLGRVEVERGAAAHFQAAMGLVDDLRAPSRPAPVNRREVVVDGRLVAFHGRDCVLGAAVLNQAARRCLLGVQGVERDDAPGQAQLSGQRARGRNLAALFADLDLPQDQATAVLDRGHHHPLPVCNPFRGAPHLLAVHGNAAVAAVLPAPGAQRLVERVRRQFREDVMKGRDRRHGVASTGGAEEPAHRLTLLVVEAGRELAEGGHAAVAGQARRNHDRQVAGKTVASAPCLAKVGHLLEKIAQAAQLRRRQRRRLRAKPPLGRLPFPPERLPGARRQFAHIHLLRLPVLTPARRPAGQAREPARHPQHPPVRRPVAGAREPRRVHERFRDKNRMTMRRAHVARQPPKAQAQHPGGQVVRLPLAGQQHEAAVVGDEPQAPELPGRRPADPPIPHPDLERARRPPHQRQPVRPVNRHVAQRLTEQGAERKIVKFGNQRVPAATLLRAPHRTYRHLVQHNTLRDTVSTRHDPTTLPQRLLNRQLNDQPP